MIVAEGFFFLKWGFFYYNQGYGKSLWLMHGMFKANGGCGYVKKPDFLMQKGDDVFNPKTTLLVIKTLKVTTLVQI